MVPRQLQQQRAMIVGTVIAIVNVALLVAVLGLYILYSRIDLQIQRLVREVMDEQGIGIRLRPTLSREDSSQRGRFFLPEFINVDYLRRKSGEGNNGAGGAPSEQMSTITFG
jgi:hypothetical protein